MNTAVIVAAGSGSRMSAIFGNKLLLPLCGVPVLARTLQNYQKAKSIDSILVVTRRELFETVADFAAQYGITKFVGCIEGGASRQESVLAGVGAAEGALLVAIADGARPFTTPAEIDAVSKAAADGGAILCVPCKDTVKVLDNEGKIVSTPPRESLRLAQTPQTFVREQFLPLLEQAVREGQSVTDDASIFELYGRKVCAVEGSYNNIKITTPEDIAAAEAIVKGESI